MALITNFESAGDGKVQSSTATTRAYLTESTASLSLTAGSTPTLYTIMEYWREIRETEVKEWVGLTYAAAESQRSANTQPSAVTGEERSYSYSVDEDQRPVQSYRLVRTYERNLNYEYLNTLLNHPSISVASGAKTYPFNVTINITAAYGGMYQSTAVDLRTAYGAWTANIVTIPVVWTINAPCVLEVRGRRDFYNGTDLVTRFSAINRAIYT